MLASMCSVVEIALTDVQHSGTLFKSLSVADCVFGVGKQILHYWKHQESSFAERMCFETMLDWFVFSSIRHNVDPVNRRSTWSSPLQTRTSCSIPEEATSKLLKYCLKQTQSFCDLFVCVLALVAYSIGQNVVLE